MACLSRLELSEDSTMGQGRFLRGVREDQCARSERFRDAVLARSLAARAGGLFGQARIGACGDAAARSGEQGLVRWLVCDHLSRRCIA